jgi:hypothetical protein
MYYIWILGRKSRLGSIPGKEILRSIRISGWIYYEESKKV